MEPSKSVLNTSSIVVHPVGKRDGKDGNIGMFDMMGGNSVHTLEGHWERSNCGEIVDRGGALELLTGGTDGTVMTWRYGGNRRAIDEAEDNREGGNGQDEGESGSSTNMMSRVWGGEDNWSD